MTSDAHRSGTERCAEVLQKIRGEHLHLETLPQQIHVLLEQDGDGTGLLAGGTAGHPDADHGASVLAGKKSWDDLFLQRRERLRVAEETGNADQQIAKEGLHFGRGLLQVADVLTQPFDLVDGHTPLDAAADGVLLVLRKVVAGLGARLVGDGVLEDDEDDGLLAEIEGLIDRFGEDVLAENLLRYE